MTAAAPVKFKTRKAVMSDCDLAGAFGIFMGLLLGLAVHDVLLSLAYRAGIVVYVGLKTGERKEQ